MFANQDGELPMNSLYTELHWLPRCPKEFPDRLKPLGMSTCWELLVDEAAFEPRGEKFRITVLDRHGG